MGLSIGALLLVVACGGRGTESAAGTTTTLELTSNEILSEIRRRKPRDDEGAHFIWAEDSRYLLTKARLAIEANFELETGSEPGQTLRLESGTFYPVERRMGVPVVRGVAPLSLKYGDSLDDGADTAIMYGGWLDHSWFFTYLTGHESGSVAVSPSAFGWSIGGATQSLPVGGSATWLGLMVAGDTERRELLHGDARLTVDFAATNVDVAFTNIRETETGARRQGIRFTDVPMSAGGFALGQGGNTIAGAFYGPSHLEVGGAFEHDNTIGAFGARRQ